MDQDSNSGKAEPLLSGLLVFGVYSAVLIVLVFAILALAAVFLGTLV